METTKLRITQNAERKRFELDTDGKLSIIEYIQMHPDTIALTHTEVHPDLEGQGVGSRLVRGVLELLEQQNKKVMPFCSFVAAYIRRHPEWMRIVSDEYDDNEADF